MDFKDKVVIITGGSSGIGAETAIQFAQQSAKVVIVGRNEQKLRNVAVPCENAKGIKPLVIKADVTIDSDVKSIVEKTIERFGQIDILVNNAGIVAEAKIQDGIEVYDRVMNTNLRSVYLLTSLAVPYLIKTRGSIVNISSVAGQKAVSKFVVYCTSKAGLDMFTKSLAKELGEYGVRVNAISPGPVKTDIIAAAGMDAEAFVRSREATSPLGKIAVSKDIADMVLYLASDKANSITGSIYVIDNGRMLE